jgi:hypothetical protein
MTSTVARGRAFEAAAVRALARWGLALAAVGGAGDGGVDLRGAWRVATDMPAVPVVGQCKAHRALSGPAHVRELEGSLGAEPRPALGLLVAAAGCVGRGRAVRFGTNAEPASLSLRACVCVCVQRG